MCRRKGVLFSGTIDSNLRYGRRECDERRTGEGSSHCAGDRIYRTERRKVWKARSHRAERNVSGGQKQRLSIARAIAKQPEIYIFDDSFSALDFKTDAALRKALKEETEEATTLIVAQRISTILHADRILVLDEGKIVGMGTHKELMQSCEVYQQIAQSQLSQEELDHE